ncbi:MAG: hypothetical protein HZA00_13875 [Nitrospinae bacterium]|nr:hypothetical protein [Nitrospinota bacterium]
MYRNFNNGIASPSARNDTARKGVIARGEAPKQSNSTSMKGGFIWHL